MSAPTSRKRVAVIGGGVLGLSTATELQRRGAETVLVTETELSNGASGRSLAWLNSFGNLRSAEYHRLRTLGMERYARLAEEPAAKPFIRLDGGLTWPAPGQTEAYRDHLQHMDAIGYPAVWLTREEIALHTPGIDAAAVSPDGAIFSPHEGWVDLPSLIDHLAREFRAAGGTLIENAGGARVVLDGVGRARGVRTAAGELHESDATVMATGPAVPEMLAGLGVNVPDRTPVALLVKTKPSRTALRAVLNTPHVAVRPTLDGGLAMDSDEAAAEVIGDERYGYEVKESTVEDLMAHASAILAEHPRLEVDWYGVGRKPIPGDGDPVLGAVAAIPGLSVAFTHSGATLGLIAGELIAGEILDELANPLLAPFNIARFDG